jgi:hypothetical protein
MKHAFYVKTLISLSLNSFRVNEKKGGGRTRQNYGWEASSEPDTWMMGNM